MPTTWMTSHNKWLLYCLHHFIIMDIENLHLSMCVEADFVYMRQEFFDTNVNM